MNLLLGILVLGVLGIALEIFRRQVKADREFLEWMERGGPPREDK